MSRSYENEQKDLISEVKTEARKNLTNIDLVFQSIETE